MKHSPLHQVHLIGMAVFERLGQIKRVHLMCEKTVNCRTVGNYRFCCGRLNFTTSPPLKSSLGQNCLCKTNESYGTPGFLVFTSPLKDLFLLLRCETGMGVGERDLAMKMLLDYNAHGSSPLAMWAMDARSCNPAAAGEPNLSHPCSIECHGAETWL